jgi:hypothetical protein
LCPSQATVGGFGGTASDVSGPLDGTCGANSAVQINIPSTTDYGKLQFNSSMPNYPSYLPLQGLLGLSANVSFTSSGTDQPFFMLDFTDSSNSLGQTAVSDQILMIEFQSSTLSANILAVDPASTLFNLYDNTTGTYLEGGQSHTNTIDGWLSSFPAMGSEALNGIWIGEGLTSGNTGPESLTVNSLEVRSVPEPSSIALFGAGLAILGFLGLGRRRHTSQA